MKTIQSIRKDWNLIESLINQNSTILDIGCGEGELIEQLKKDGIGIIYITHRINEIKRVGNRITVLRDGKFIDTIPVEEASDTKLVELMTGRVVDQVFPEIKKKTNIIYMFIDLQLVCL